MVSRVNYLAKEEQKFLKKIQKTRSNAQRQAQIKDDKIAQLQERLETEKREAALLREKAEDGKSQREKAQASKLKNAYENLVKYEAQREQEKKNREELKMIARKQKNRDMAQKFQQAEIIRAEER